VTRREWRKLVPWVVLGIAMTCVSLVHVDVPFCTSWERGWPWPVVGNYCPCAGPEEEGGFVSIVGIVVDVGFYTAVSACLFGGAAAILRLGRPRDSREHLPRLP